MGWVGCGGWVALWFVRVVRRAACTVSWAFWLLFTGVLVRCAVFCVRCPGPLGSCSPVRTLCSAVWCARCPGPLGSCSPVCTLLVCRCVCGVLGPLARVHRCACFGVLCRGHGVLGHLAPVHRCAHSMRGVACAASWATWLLFTGARARYVVCAVSWATWLLFTGVHALRAVLCVRCPGPFGSCLPVCSCGVCCVACVASWDPWFVFTGVFDLCVAVCCGLCGVTRGDTRVCCVVLFVRSPGSPGSCSPMCTLGVRCCVCGVPGLLAPVHRCARPVCGVACVVSFATWLLFTGVLVWRVWCCVCGVLGLLAPVHRCACSV